MSTLEYFKLNVGDPAGHILNNKQYLIREDLLCETTSCKENGLQSGEEKNIVNQCFSCSQKILTLFRKQRMARIAEFFEKQYPLKTNLSEGESLDLGILNNDTQGINQSVSIVREFLQLYILEEKNKIKNEEEKEKSALTSIITNPLRFVPCPKCRRLFHFSRMIIRVVTDYGCPMCVS